MKAKAIIKYIIIFGFFCLMFFLEKNTKLYPFAIGLFMALCYLRQNLLVLIPIYIASAVIVDFSLFSFITALSPCLVIGVAYFVHYKLKRNISLLFIYIYTALSLVAKICVECTSVSKIVYAILSTIFAEILVFIFVTVLYDILVKKCKFKPDSDEIISFGIAFLVFGGSLAYLYISWYYALFTLLVFVILIMLSINNRYAMLTGITMSIGGAVAVGDYQYIVFGAVYAIIACVFGKNYRYLASIGIIAGDVIIRIFFKKSEFSFLELVAPSVGAVLYMAIPKRIINKISYLFGEGMDEVKLGRALINRDRESVSKDICLLADTCLEIRDVLNRDIRNEAVERKINKISEDVYCRCCDNCGNLTSCKNSLGGSSPIIVVNEVVKSAIDIGKTGILDMPSFLSLRCKKVNGMINIINESVKEYLNKKEEEKEIEQGKNMIAEQFAGMGNVLKNMGKKVNRKLKYDTDLEREIEDELIKYNISASEVIVYFENDKYANVMVVAEEKDLLKQKITDTISEKLGVQMQIKYIEPLVKNRAMGYFVRKRGYSVAYGKRSISKVMDNPSGDNIKVSKVGENDVMVILSDGMGSGAEASENSLFAVSLIEKFYKAGCDYNMVANIVGRILSVRQREEFNAVDILLIDTLLGYADFIKFGGRESFIINRGAVEVIECGSLPIGIVDESVPVFEHKKIGGGTFIVMLSDGITDYISRDELITIMEQTRTENPDIFAEEIIKEVKKRLASSEKDDASVIVVKIFDNVG